jgi:tRNA A37 threonylcarbamoyladenosine synthetase subunit TsaC/SUA5/YrdC
VPATRSVPRTLTDAKRRTVGIRVTSHPIAQALAVALGRPLLTTSAIAPATGEPCRDADEILEVFGRHIDVVIDTEQTPAEPSTVIEVDGDNITLIREGAGAIDGVLDV